MKKSSFLMNALSMLLLALYAMSMYSDSLSLCVHRFYDKSNKGGNNDDANDNIVNNVVRLR